MWRLLARLRRDRRGATAVIVAITLPAMLITMATALETAMFNVRNAELQSTADASAGAARQVYDSFTSGRQQAAVDEALRIAGLNQDSDKVAAADVVEGWWDITKAQGDDNFGPPVAGQTGLPFSNAIRVTARLNYMVRFAQFLGVDNIAIARTGTAYKCSNTDYPYTLIADDIPPPSLPAIWMSWSTPEYPDPHTSYYYEQPNGARNPIFKFYSPYDGEDVSFVLHMSNGDTIQVDTYCAGTYLVSPAEFDTRQQSGQNFRNGDNSPVTVTGYVLRGSTNNSFDTYADQTQYPFAFQPTPYYTANEVPTPQYDDSKIKTTPYPSYNGIHYWASEGNPTPDRRALLVR